MRIANAPVWDPLTRPAPAGESAGGGTPSPPGGRGLGPNSAVFAKSGELKDHEIFAQNDAGRVTRRRRTDFLLTAAEERKHGFWCSAKDLYLFGADRTF